jgi:predicted RNA methylase
VSSTANLHIQAFRFRDVRYEVTMLDADGDVISIDSTNVLKMKIGKKGLTPHLELSSVSSSARGSQIVLGNPFGIILTSADLQFAAGIYDVEILVLDNATSAIITSLKHGVFALHETMRGS